ncbi:MAG: hypothetical protein AB7V22_02275 [Kiritimatiellia bacterium]
MLQRALAKVIATMIGAGLLGMLGAHVLFGQLNGTPIGFAVLFSGQPPPVEIGSPAPDEIDDARNIVLAGGCTGLLLGLAASAGLARRSA